MITLNVSIKPFQFSSSSIDMKSKCKGLSSSYYFCPFFLGLAGAFFFLAPSFFYYYNLFYYSFFLLKYYSSSFSLSSTPFLSLRFHFINTFLPSKSYYLTVFILQRYVLYSAKVKSDFFKNSLVLINQALYQKFVNLFSRFYVALTCTFFLN